MVDMVHGNGRGAGILRRDVMEALSHKLAREVDLIHLFSPALLSSKYTVLVFLVSKYLFTIVDT
jgi:hypothetical protein